MRTILISPIILTLALCLVCPVSAGESHKYDKPEDVVASLYRGFAWEAVMDKAPEGASLVEQPKEVLGLYFTDELVSLILKDRECVEKTHEICRLDFNPIFASQDPGASELNISPANNSGVVRVQFMHPANHERMKLNFKTEKSTQGWRVSDIGYKDGSSLRKLLAGP